MAGRKTDEKKVCPCYYSRNSFNRNYCCDNLVLLKYLVTYFAKT